METWRKRIRACLEILSRGKLLKFSCNLWLRGREKAEGLIRCSWLPVPGLVFHRSSRGCDPGVWQGWRRGHRVRPSHARTHTLCTALGERACPADPRSPFSSSSPTEVDQGVPYGELLLPPPASRPSRPALKGTLQPACSLSQRSPVGAAQRVLRHSRAEQARARFLHSPGPPRPAGDRQPCALALRQLSALRKAASTGGSALQPLAPNGPAAFLAPPFQGLWKAPFPA